MAHLIRSANELYLNLFATLSCCLKRPRRNVYFTFKQTLNKLSRRLVFKPDVVLHFICFVLFFRVNKSFDKKLLSGNKKVILNTSASFRQVAYSNVENGFDLLSFVVSFDEMTIWALLNFSGPVIFGYFENLKMEAVRGQIFYGMGAGFRRQSSLLGQQTSQVKLEQDKTVLEITTPI